MATPGAHASLSACTSSLSLCSWQTSKLLSTQLVQYVARELNDVFEGKLPESLAASARQTLSHATATAKSQAGKIWELIGGSTPPETPAVPPPTDLSGNPAVVRAALKAGFLKLDHEITTAPLRLLQKREEAGKQGRGPLAVNGVDTQPTLATTTAALQTLLPALSGSCALLAYLDTARHRCARLASTAKA
jgi:pyruvate dehydrogenase phosphatase